MTFQLIHSEIEQFIYEHQNKPSEIYTQLDQYNHLNNKSAHLQSSLLQIQYLIFFSNLIQPSFALDIGTFNGASAMALAEGIQPSGFVHTIELNPAQCNIASTYIEKHKRKRQIIQHCGSAIEIIPTLNLNWDLVFIDADKANYLHYLNLVLPKLSAHGLIIVDNIFFHGDIFDINNQSQRVNGIRNFNHEVKNNPKLNISILPIRDGLMLISKK